MKEVHATPLILGQSRRQLWYSLMRETVVHFMLCRARWVDMLIVADFNNSYTYDGNVTIGHILIQAFRQWLIIIVCSIESG